MANHKHDIEKYLRGELTPAEMNALEKKALTDPFLADALAGAESITAHELMDDLKNIRASLQDRIGDEKKHISLWGWTYRIAAGLLLIAVATYLIINLPGKKENDNNLALNKEKTVTPQVPAEEQKEMEKAEPQTLPQKEIVDSKPRVESKAKDTQKKSNLRDESAQPRRNDLAVADEVVTEESVIVKETRDEAESQKPEAKAGDDIAADSTHIDFARSAPVAATAPAQAKRRQDGLVEMDAPVSKAAGQHIVNVIKGKVIDAEDGTGMPGVNVTIKNTSAGTTTDINGNYEISLDDPNAELVFSFVGYNNVEVPAEKKDNLNVEMSTDYAALSEVIVVGYAPPKNGMIDLEAEEKNIYAYAEPLGGRKAYKSYLVQNMHYPELALENKVEGKVTVQFTVETNGLLNDFKVLKSIGYGCDEEVIRLVKKGPNWAPAKRNDIPLRGKVKVRLRFNLPK